LPEVDRGRLGLIGYSFGAMMAAELASGALRGLALVSPPIALGDLRVGWGCPAFLLAGDRDDIVPVERLQVVAEAPDVELRLVSGADHSWWGFEDELGGALGEFFHRHFQ
jgi:alpha/beta superfamily hydrolase